MTGFYGVVDDPGSVAAARSLAEALVSGGACAVQLRMKRASTRAFVDAAKTLAAMRLGVPFIVNDRLDVALVSGADGVHLGQDDLPIAAARAAAPRITIGVSTHNLEQAMAAARAGADYLGYGPIFATSTKENPDPVQGLAALAAAVRAVAPVPIVAIGGITPELARDVAATGAACACAISSVIRAPDVAAAARKIASAFT